MRVGAGVIVGLIVACSTASVVRADDTHYRGVPIGAHAVGLGGAFTGVADDVSAAYYNPAGLALGGAVGIAAGLSINAWEREDVENVFLQPDGQATATTKTSRTVPIFVGAAIRLGPKDKYGDRKYVIGISVVEPIFSTGGVFLKFRSDPIELSDSYRVAQNDRGTWYGLSFAGKLKGKHSLGASIYLSVRKLNHSETGILLNGGVPVPGDPNAFVGVNTGTNTQNLNFKAFHFVPRIGWLAQLKPQLRVGAMLQLPGIPLKQKVDVLSQGFLTDGGGGTEPPVTRAYYLDQQSKANLPIPLELEVGLQYWPAEQVMLAFDASFNAPVKSSTRVKSDVQVPLGGAFFDTDTGRTAAGNVAVAGDFYIGRVVMIEAGFFTDLSSALKIPENPQRYYSPRVHRLGGTLSVGFNVAGIGLAVGSTVLYGRGNATGLTVDLDGFMTDYRRTQARSRVVYLHITGATRAAEDVSKKTANKIQERQLRKKQEEEERRRQEEEERRQREEEAVEAGNVEEASESP